MTKPSPELKLEALLAWRDTPGTQDGRARLSNDDLVRLAHQAEGTPESVRRVILPSRRLVAELADEISACLAEVERSPAPSEEPLVPDPVIARGRDEASPPSEGQVSPGGFAPYQFTTTAIGAAHTIHVDGTDVSWRPFESAPLPEVIIYRLVAGEEVEPPTPELGRLTAVTTEPRAGDGDPFHAAVRYYSVWVNFGPDIDSAKRAQPLRWAGGIAVAPVTNCFFVNRDRQVIGRWEAAPGTDRVDVLRHAPSQHGYRPMDRLEPRPDNRRQLEGFVDTTGEPGATYGYSAYAVRVVAGSDRYSAPVTRLITIPVIPDPVTDLNAQAYFHEGQSVMDIDWTQPTVGKVQVFLTEQEPDQALAKQGAIEVERLATTPLLPEQQILHPPAADGLRRRISQVPWQRGWKRAYVTPVTFAGDLAAVGPSRSFTRMDPIRDVDLRERVDSQMIVFDWPDGAAAVKAYVTAPGEPLDTSRLPHALAELSELDYERFGGLRLTLGGAACSLHLIPVAYQAARAEYGQVETVHYAGLARLRYRFYRVLHVKKKKLTGKEEVIPGPVQVLVRADRDLSAGIDFALVCNSDRLPLHIRDGTAAPITKTMERLDRDKEVLLLQFDRPLPAGRYRLFGRLRSSQVPLAVIDPDVEQLRR